MAQRKSRRFHRPLSLPILLRMALEELPDDLGGIDLAAYRPEQRNPRGPRPGMPAANDRVESDLARALARTVGDAANTRAVFGAARREIGEAGGGRAPIESAPQRGGVRDRQHAAAFGPLQDVSALVW